MYETIIYCMGTWFNRLYWSINFTFIYYIGGVMARYTIHRDYEDNYIHKKNYLQNEIQRLNRYILLVILKEIM